MRRYYSRGEVSIDLSEEQWKLVDRLKEQKKGKLLVKNIHHRNHLWINDFSRLLAQILQEDNKR